MLDSPAVVSHWEWEGVAHAGLSPDHGYNGGHVGPGDLLEAHYWHGQKGRGLAAPAPEHQEQGKHEPKGPC